MTKEDRLKSYTNGFPEIEQFWRDLCQNDLDFLWFDGTRVWWDDGEQNQLIYAHWDGPFSFPDDQKQTGHDGKTFVRLLKLRGFE